jgi:hypothetical protein
VSGEELDVEDFGSNIHALGTWYPSQVSPSLVHRWQDGLPSSHLTLLFLQVAHPVRTLGASRRIRGLLDSVILWLPSRHQQITRVNSFVGSRQCLDSVCRRGHPALAESEVGAGGKDKELMKLITSN